MNQIFNESIIYSSSLILGSNSRIVFTKSDKDAYNLYCQAKFFFGESSGIELLYLPEFDQQYDMVSPSDEIIQERSWCLSILASKEKKMLIASVGSLLQKLPPKKYYEDNVALSVGEVVNLDDLCRTLTYMGFVRMGTAFSSGEFAVRGDIIDIVLPGLKGYRIVLAWNKIEQIKEIDLSTQISRNKIDSLTIYRINEVPLTSDHVNNFKKQTFLNALVQAIQTINYIRKLCHYKKRIG